MADVLRVCALYPDLMNIYADRGNIAVLTQRAAWRGHELEVRLESRVVGGRKRVEQMIMPRRVPCG